MQEGTLVRVRCKYEWLIKCVQEGVGERSRLRHKTVSHLLTAITVEDGNGDSDRILEDFEGLNSIIFLVLLFFGSNFVDFQVHSMSTFSKIGKYSSWSYVYENTSGSKQDYP